MHIMCAPKECSPVYAYVNSMCSFTPSTMEQLKFQLNYNRSRIKK